MARTTQEVRREKTARSQVIGSEYSVLSRVFSRLFSLQNALRESHWTGFPCPDPQTIILKGSRDTVGAGRWQKATFDKQTKRPQVWRHQLVFASQPQHKCSRFRAPEQFGIKFMSGSRSFQQCLTQIPLLVFLAIWHLISRGQPETKPGEFERGSAVVRDAALHPKGWTDESRSEPGGLNARHQAHGTPHRWLSLVTFSSSTSCLNGETFTLGSFCKRTSVERHQRYFSPPISRFL